MSTHKVYAATVCLEVTYLIAASSINGVNKAAKRRFLRDLEGPGELPNGRLSVPAVDETSADELSSGDPESLCYFRNEALVEYVQRAAENRSGGKKNRKKS